MPSPIAHSAVAIVLWPAAAHRGCGRPPVRLASARGLVLLGGVLFMLNAPDLDFIPHLFLGSDIEPLLQHGGATHSFLAGAVAAVLFASVLGPLTGLGWSRLFIVGLIAWSLHIVMDFFTWRGGAMALWPISGHRFSSPVPLFYGARHSQPFAFHLHLITLTTEMMFALLLWLASRSQWMRRIAAASRCAGVTDGRARPTGGSVTCSMDEQTV